MIDRDFPYRMNSRGGGRTTRLMITANDLARMPHTIVYLYPGTNMARDGLDWMAGVLHQLGDQTFSLCRRHDGGKHIECANGSLIHVIPWSVQPGRFVAEATRLSILFDHTCSPADDYWAFNGPMSISGQNQLGQWEEACQVAIEVADVAKSNRPLLFRDLL